MKSPPFPTELPDSLSDPLAIREHDWASFQSLEMMSSHWDRPGWWPGRRAYYWFLNFRHPDLVDAALRVQAALRWLPFDPIPPDGLHLTLVGIGNVNDIDREAVQRVAAAAGTIATSPIRLSIGPVAGSRGAVRFSVAPWAPLLALHARIADATSSALEVAVNVDASVSRFRPHVAAAYCNAVLPARTVRECVEPLRQVLPPVEVIVTAACLVELHREPGRYAGTTLYEVPLTDEAR